MPKGSVPHFYTNAVAPSSGWLVNGGAPRDGSCVRRERWGQRDFRAGARGRQDVDVPVLTPDPSRSAWVFLVGDGSCVRRERWGQRGLRAGARGGTGCRRSSAHSGPIPLRRGVFGGGWVLRSQGTLGPAGPSRWRARGGQDVDVPVLTPDPSRSACVFLVGEGALGRWGAVEAGNGPEPGGVGREGRSNRVLGQRFVDLGTAFG